MRVHTSEKKSSHSKCENNKKKRESTALRDANHFKGKKALQIKAYVWFFYWVGFTSQFVTCARNKCLLATQCASYIYIYEYILVALTLSHASERAHAVINFTNSRRIKIDGRMFYPPDNNFASLFVRTGNWSQSVCFVNAKRIEKQNTTQYSREHHFTIEIIVIGPSRAGPKQKNQINQNTRQNPIETERECVTDIKFTRHLD